jgi:hypothetical protein
VQDLERSPSLVQILEDSSQPLLSLDDLLRGVEGLPDAGSPLEEAQARAVGDILTIQVQESNSVTKDNSTSTAKKSGVDASIASFLFGPGASGLLTKGGQFPSLKLEGKSDFTGGGKINNTENIMFFFNKPPKWNECKFK